MQFFITILITVFLWVIFYVIISLKLEKSASEFREKKLRKEMDEIIKEFNSTAERNISLLEKKIKTLKMLLERNGEIKSVDFILDENGFKEHTVSRTETAVGHHDSGGIEKKSKQDVETISITNIDMDTVSSDFKKRLIFIKNKFIDSFNDIKWFSKNRDIVQNFTQSVKSKGLTFDKIESGQELFPIVKEIGDLGSVNNSSIDEKLPEEVEEKFLEFSDEELEKFFKSTDDRYRLVSELYRKGYSADSLSRFSGIPAGEIKLVLNLEQSM